MPVLNDPKLEAYAQALVTESTQAAALRKSYTPARSWPAKKVHSTASTWAARSDVKGRLAELQSQAADQAVVRKADAVRQLRAVLTSDIRACFTADGRPKLAHELDDSTAAAVAVFKVDEAGGCEVRFHPKIPAIDQASKMLGLYEKDNKQKDPLSELLARLNGRVAGPSLDNSARDPDNED